MTGTTVLSVRNVLVIHNPRSGWRRVNRLDAIVRLLKELGCAVTIRETACAGHATALAEDGVAEGFDVIVAAGGDGTINEIANALPEHGPPLGVIPLGTANVLAWEIGLGRRKQRVARTIAFGEPRTITVGRVNGRGFLLMVGIGYDGAVVACVSPRVKRWLGKGAYLCAGIAQMLQYGWPPLSVSVDGVVRPCAMAIVTKSRHYAGRFILARDASIEDSLFRVSLFAGGGIWNVLRYGAGLMFGCLPWLSDVVTLQASEVQVAAPLGVAVQADGEAIGATPAVVTIAPARIRVLWPESR